jgi:hypothetical protein
MLVSLYRLSNTDISVSALLSSYIPTAKTFQCPNAPSRHQHFDTMYADGNNYDNPDTRFRSDPFHGSYALWWNYKGCLASNKPMYRGPSRNTAPPNAMLTSDTLFTDHYLISNSYLTGLVPPNPCDLPQVRYASCEKLPRASRSNGNFWQTPFWYTKHPSGLPNIDLQASLVDGSVQTFSSFNTTTLRVLLDPARNIPYPENVGMPSYQIPLSIASAKSN